MITDRLSTKVTERLERPSFARRCMLHAQACYTLALYEVHKRVGRADLIELGKVGLMLWAIVLLILFAARMVVQLDSQGVAVLAAFGVAGVIWLAFGKR